MRNPKSVQIIVAISVLVGLLHFVTGPQYNWYFKDFVNGYLIDILLPMNVYLLFQLAARKRISVKLSRISGTAFVFILAYTVEILQKNSVPVFGSTFDPLDFVAYSVGIVLGILADFYIIERFEQANVKK